MRNPSWSRDEHIVALDFYLRHTPIIPGKDSVEVIELSRKLNLLQQNLGGETPDKFRNPSGVYMKLMNFRRFDPDYKGVGLANGNKDEEVVWDLYANQPDKLHQLAQHILSFTKPEHIKEKLPELTEEEIESNEGQILSRVHRYRERDSTLVRKKKERFLAERGFLHCECCGFNFSEVYGSHGDGFIECHHTKPVSELDADSTTKISDLALLCANCHRMIHRRKPWLSIDELRLKTIGEKKRTDNCLFCDIQTNERSRIVEENALAYAIRDGYAVTDHHTLFIPKRHIADYFGLSQAEINAINQLIQSQKKKLDSLDQTIDAYNIGMNCGEAAGQTIYHCHVHLIPRRTGDVPTPRGGVRHVIPNKGFYEDKK